jgi:hypothetical protein
MKSTLLYIGESDGGEHAGELHLDLVDTTGKRTIVLLPQSGGRDGGTAHCWTPPRLGGHDEEEHAGEFELDLVYTVG